ncbi:MAG: hypothetical protein K6A63_02080 [Acholeplasmatales bacterium]|nr:hypothetical protein [Acholeplasmatales bacterium]
MVQIKCLATGSTGNCYILKSCNQTFILDAGCKWDKIVANVNLNEVDMAYISHEHKDHSLNYKELAFRGVKCFDGINTQDFVKNENLRAKQGQYSLYRVPIHHGKTNNCALIIENESDCILYATDFNLCEYDLSEFKFTHILVECNYLESMVGQIDKDSNDYFKVKRQINTHMGLEGLKIFLDSLDLSKCQEIDLIHMSQGYGDSITMGSSIYSRYRIITGVCKQEGGIEYYGS